MTAVDDTAFWSAIAPKYAKVKVGDEAGYENTLRRTREFLQPDRQVLELGCGTGSTALKLAPYTGNYLATDIAPGMIAIANDKLTDTGLENLSFSTATAETLGGGQENFDVVLGFNYLHLVPDPVATLRHIRHLLKPGGVLITKTVCLGEMNFLIPIMISVMRFFGKAPATVRSVDEAWLVDAHEKAGFEILVNERHGTKKKDVRPYIVARVKSEGNDGQKSNR